MSDLSIWQLDLDSGFLRNSEGYLLGTAAKFYNAIDVDAEIGRLRFALKEARTGLRDLSADLTQARNERDELKEFVKVHSECEKTLSEHWRSANRAVIRQAEELATLRARVKELEGVIRQAHEPVAAADHDAFVTMVEERLRGIREVAAEGYIGAVQVRISALLRDLRPSDTEAGGEE